MDRLFRQANYKLREDWIRAVVAELQLIDGCAQLNDVAAARSVLVASRFPGARTSEEQWMLHNLLIGTACRFGTDFHEAFHRTRHRDCDFSPAVHLPRLWRRHVSNAPAMFAEWVVAYFDDFVRAHPLTRAHQAAGILKQDFQRTWTVSALAAKVHASPSQLLREFRREYHTSPKEYQRTLRLIEALTHVRGGKIDAIALQVGYRSKKGLYRAFEVMGLTPAAFRKLSPQAALELIARIRRQLIPRPS